MTVRGMIAATLLLLSPLPAVACNPTLAEPLLVSDAEFLEAAEAFEEAAPGSYARLAAYDTMLRVEGAAFGTVLRNGYLSEETDLVAAATYCEVMRANGAVARVTGLPEAAADLRPDAEAAILGFRFNLDKLETDWAQGCFSTRAAEGPSCPAQYFVAVRDGIVTFRQELNSGRFRRVDGGFSGVIELLYDSRVLTVPATLTLQ